jgi:hypothetical protein
VGDAASAHVVVEHAAVRGRAHQVLGGGIALPIKIQATLLSYMIYMHAIGNKQDEPGQCCPHLVDGRLEGLAANIALQQLHRQGQHPYQQRPVASPASWRLLPLRRYHPFVLYLLPSCYCCR